MLGIGIDTSVASADEVENAIENQKKIDKNKIEALELAINNYNFKPEIIENVLGKFGYKRIQDIMVVDYSKVINEFKKMVEG